MRKLDKGDVVRMLEWMHDPSVNCYYRFDFSKMTEESVGDFIDNSYSDRNVHFAFVDGNNSYLGTVSLKNISTVDSNAEFAIVTHKDAQGTGAAFSATLEILHYAFYELGLHKVYLNVLADNIRANKFYCKIGFVNEGCFFEHVYLNEKWHDLKWYGMTKEQYTSLYSNEK